MPASPLQYGSMDEFRASRGAKVTPLQRFAGGEHAVAGPGRLAEVVMSTATEDRASDTVSQSGWKLERFRSNPVLQWCHDYSMPPVGKVSTVLVDGGSLLGRGLVFVPREIDAFAGMVGELYTHPERFLRMFSVGFMPERWSYNEQRGGVDFLEQDLLELSACPIGMNPDALARAKSVGIGLSPLHAFAQKRLDRAPDAPLWLPTDAAYDIHKTLAPVQVQSAGVPDMNGITASIESIRQQVATYAERIAALEAKSASKAAPSPQAIAEAVVRSLSQHPALNGGNQE